jgi:ubiquinone/menaquinone biosynthesis C-methylase UbiE
MAGLGDRLPLPGPLGGQGGGQDWDDWDPARARSGYTSHVPAVGGPLLPAAPGLGLPPPVSRQRPPSGQQALSPAGLAVSARAEVEDYLTVEYDIHELGFVEVYEALFVPQWSRPFGQLLLSLLLTLQRDAGWQLLDVGCATGYPTLELARFLGQDCDLAGIDTWEEAVLFARRRAAEEWLRNVSFLVADVVTNDLPQGGFDTITSNLGLASFEDPWAALGGMWRLLREGGQLLLTTPLQSAMREFLDTYYLTLRDLKLQDYMSTLGRHIASRPTIANVSKLVERAGFVVTRTVTDTFTLSFPDPRAFLTSPLIQTLYLGELREIIPDMTIRRLVFNEVERRLTARAQVAGGELVMTVPMLCVAAVRA